MTTKRKKRLFTPEFRSEVSVPRFGRHSGFCCVSRDLSSPFEHDEAEAPVVGVPPGEVAEAVEVFADRDPRGRVGGIRGTAP